MVGTSRIFLVLALCVGAFVPGAGLGAQHMSIPDRVTWAEAMLAHDEGASTEALTLLEDVMASAGPNPAILYDAAQVAFDLRDYTKAEDYITLVLETEDDTFKASDTRTDSSWQPAYSGY